jgi:hypothetical protein
MKVYNLSCGLEHRFEGWFASEDDFLSQKENGTLCCPICDSAQVRRLPSAPHIGGKAGLEQPVSVEPTQSIALSPTDHSQLEKQIQATFIKAMRDLVNQSEDVGTSFAEEARKIHYQESPERSIRGQTSSDEVIALREEGIDVLALPEISALKNTLQ